MASRSGRGEWFASGLGNVRLLLPLAFLVESACGLGLTQNLTPFEHGDGSSDVRMDSVGDGRDGHTDGRDGPAPDRDAGADSSDGAPSDAAPFDGADGRSTERPEGGPDSEPTVPRVCLPSQAFGRPTLVPGLNAVSASVVSARFSPDELTAYLGMYHGGQIDIYTATRENRSVPFGPASSLPMVNVNVTPAEDDFPTVTADGLTLYFMSTRTGVYDNFVSTRSTLAADFSAPVELDDLHVYGEGNPFVTPDGGALYFHTYRSGNFDVLRARKNATGFDAPEPLAIDTPADESTPVVSADENTIYFRRSSDPAGPDGVWMATRSSPGDPFGAAISLPELNDPYPMAFPTWISPDGCRLYLHEADDTDGSWVYVAERQP